MPGVVPGPGVPAGRVGGVVVDEDSRGVGQGEAHDPHRSSSDRLVSGRAMTVRSGAPVLHCAYRSATGPAVGLDGTVRGEGDDVGCHRRGGGAEQQHLGEPLPGLLDGTGQRDAALRMVAGGGEPGLAQPPGDPHARPRCPPWCRCPLSRLSRCGCAGPPPGRDADWPGTRPAQSVQGRCMRGWGGVHPSSLSDSVGTRPPARMRGGGCRDRVAGVGSRGRRSNLPPARRSRRAGRRVADRMPPH